MNSNDIYGVRANGNAHGDVFTSPEIVRYMLDIVGYKASYNLSQVIVLEPSCGEGAFIIEIVRRLRDSASRYHFDFKDAFYRCVFAYDIDATKINKCKKELFALGIEPSEKNFKVADFLSSEVPMADLVIGNPPYVRYENIPESKRKLFKNIFTTFHYRSDLYVLFYEKTLRCLKANGKHCLICANRWYKNEYGKKLRNFVAQNYRLESIINLERANAFQEKVLAYPAITLISKQSRASTLSYAEVKSVQELKKMSFSTRPVPKNDDWSCIFSKAVVNENLYTIEELGFRIGIGVATGADHVFISKDLPKLVEKELLLPALNAKNLTGNQLHWNGEFLLNPYAENGELINLSKFPRVEKYLKSFKEKLSNRHIVKKNNAKWYKTIDKINPQLIKKSKILLPDISGNRFVFLDEGNYYPLHNLYYITGNTLRDQKILSAFLMSDAIRTQIASITNNMNGGFPRWQSQHLRKLRIPNIKEMGESIANRLLQSYDQKKLDSINEIVNYAYKDLILTRKGKGYSGEQTSLNFI